MTPSHTWEPPLKGSEALAAERAVLGIARRLAGYDGAASAFDAAEIALFFTYLARSRLLPGSRELAARWLHVVFEKTAADEQPVALFGGLAGIGWIVEHIRKLEPELIDEDAGGDLDAALLAAVSTGDWPGPYDLVPGLAGVGIYALERSTEEARQILHEVIRQLHRMATALGDDGYAWWTAAPFISPGWTTLCPSGAYNLGLAHGGPGVVALLAKTMSAAPSDTVASLLRGASRWLLAQRRPDGLFSPVVGEDLPPARSAWCYGGPGIALALTSAAEVLDDRGLRDAAIAILLREAGRDDASAGVVECSLCHGAIGLAHLHARLAQRLAEPQLRSVAHRWYRRALDEWTSDETLSGFRDDDGSSNLLTGATGIGLALLSSMSDIPPDWDRLLAYS
jgi:lantibiotic modifying enzyme